MIRRIQGQWQTPFGSPSGPGKAASGFPVEAKRAGFPLRIVDSRFVRATHDFFRYGRVPNSMGLNPGNDLMRDHGIFAHIKPPGMPLCDHRGGSAWARDNTGDRQRRHGIIRPVERHRGMGVFRAGRLRFMIRLSHGTSGCRITVSRERSLSIWHFPRSRGLTLLSATSPSLI